MRDMSTPWRPQVSAGALYTSFEEIMSEVLSKEDRDVITWSAINFFLFNNF